MTVQLTQPGNVAWQDEGTPILVSRTANFVGTPVTVTDVGGVATITITGGTTTLPAAYAAGGAGPQVLALDSTRLGVVLRDNAAPIGTVLLGAQDSGGTVEYLGVYPTYTIATGYRGGSFNIYSGATQIAGLILNGLEATTTTIGTFVDLRRTDIVTAMAIGTAGDRLRIWHYAGTATAGKFLSIGGGGAFVEVASWAYDGGQTLTQTTTWSNTLMQLTGAANSTALPGPFEKHDVYINSNRIVTWVAGVGTLPAQRTVRIDPQTIAFNGAASVTNAITFCVVGPPIVGTNATFTNAYAAYFGGAINVVQDAAWQTTLLTLTGTANVTNFTASIEKNDVWLNLNRIGTWATGAITNQRAIYIQAPTYAFAGASTITSAYTLYVDGPPIAGTNATLTNTYAAYFGGAVTLVQGVAWKSVLLNLTGAANSTNLAASVEVADADFNLARTVTFATGAIASQRAVRFRAPTYAFAGASTVTDASTVYISGAPILGTNATFTNKYALLINSSAVADINLAIISTQAQTAAHLVITNSTASTTGALALLTKNPNSGSASGHGIDIVWGTTGGTLTGNAIRIVQAGSASNALVQLTTNSTGNGGLAISHLSGSTDGILVTCGAAQTRAIAVTCSVPNPSNSMIAITLNPGSGSGAADSINIGHGTGAGVVSGHAINIAVGAASTGNGELITMSGVGDALNVVLSHASSQALVVTSGVATTNNLVDITQSTAAATGHLVSLTKSPGSGTTAGNGLDITWAGGAGTLSGHAINITATKHSGDCIHIAKTPAGSLGGDGIDVSMGANCTGKTLNLAHAGSGDVITAVSTGSGAILSGTVGSSFSQTAGILIDVSAIPRGGSGAAFAFSGPQGLNFQRISSGAVATTDGTATKIWTWTPSDGTTGWIEATIQASRDNGTDYGTWKVLVQWKRAAGAITLSAAVSIATTLTGVGAATWTAVITQAAGDLSVTGTAAAAQNVKWECRVDWFAQTY